MKMTVLQYAAVTGLPTDLRSLAFLSERASALSREQDLPIDRVKDQRFGLVNSYHESILDACIAEILSGD